MADFASSEGLATIWVLLEIALIGTVAVASIFAIVQFGGEKLFRYLSPSGEVSGKIVVVGLALVFTLISIWLFLG